MNILIREYNQNDLEAMIEIWNQVSSGCAGRSD